VALSVAKLILPGDHGFHHTALQVILGGAAIGAWLRIARLRYVLGLSLLTIGLPLIISWLGQFWQLDPWWKDLQNGMVIASIAGWFRLPCSSKALLAGRAVVRIAWTALLAAGLAAVGIPQIKALVGLGSEEVPPMLSQENLFVVYAVAVYSVLGNLLLSTSLCAIVALKFRPGRGTASGKSNSVT